MQDPNEPNTEKEQTEEVGYRKPPKGSRFKKGVSGNPKGRPKGSPNVGTALQKALRERVVVNENGQRKTITKLEAALKQLVNKGASGDLRALRHLTELALHAENQSNAASSQNPIVTESDEGVMKGILERLQMPMQNEHDQIPNEADALHDQNQPE